MVWGSGCAGVSMLLVLEAACGRMFGNRNKLVQVHLSVVQTYPVGVVAVIRGCGRKAFITRDTDDTEPVD